MRTLVFTLALCALAAGRPAAQRAPARTRITTDAHCASDLGKGLKSQRQFCDVIIATEPADSVSMTIPPHAGTATMRFDLHDRFTIPALAGVSGPLVFARQEAVVSLVRPGGGIIGHAAVVREFRSVADLFDQLAGTERPGGVKAVAPGQPESVQFIVPAGVSTVGVVGTRLKILTRAGDETVDTPGRPIALVSNLRIEYRPGR